MLTVMSGTSIVLRQSQLGHRHLTFGSMATANCLAPYQLLAAISNAQTLRLFHTETN